MRILIAYATTDGQTRKIAQKAAEICMNAGHSVELLPTSEGEGLDLQPFGAVILAGSLHAGGYQKSLSEFASAHQRQLNALPTLFLSVSLSAAGTDDADWKGLTSAKQEFFTATGWKPGAIEQVAGAFRFSKYDVFRGFVMRRIARAKDPAMSVSEDHEYTDWVKLDRDVAAWLAAANLQKAA